MGKWDPARGREGDPPCQPIPTLSFPPMKPAPISINSPILTRSRPRREGIEAFMGSRVHDALEKLYRDLMKVNKLNTLEEFSISTIRVGRRIGKR